MTRTAPRNLALTALLAMLIAVIGLAPASAEAQPTWAPADQATITPGVQTFTDGGQCTANFVFHGDGDIYIGQAAHCAGTGGQTETDGCDSGSLPLGTPVEVTGATQPGTLAYSSWLTMQDVGEDDPNACAYNDFALIKLDPADHDLVNPSLPVIGGPVGINTDGTVVGEQLHSYGNSGLRLGLSPLSPKTAISLGTSGDGWTHSHYAVSPGIPGDSGSPFLDEDGNALGVLSTLVILPVPLSNNASDVNLAINYMRANGGPRVDLALGTEPFTPLIGTGPTAPAGVWGLPG